MLSPDDDKLRRYVDCHTEQVSSKSVDEKDQTASEAGAVMGATGKKQ